MENASELHDEPLFEAGTKVQAIRMVRNDGTYPGVPTGTVLIESGDVGYVKSVGTYLNRYYIYAVDFVNRGVLVGMRGHELECLECP
jgi:nitrogen fixation protein NifZ